MIIFTNASGINFFHPRFISWSYRKRGMVHRIHKNRNRKNPILVIITAKLMAVIQKELNPQDASFTNGIS